VEALQVLAANHVLAADIDVLLLRFVIEVDLDDMIVNLHAIAAGNGTLGILLAFKLHICDGVGSGELVATLGDIGALHPDVADGAVFGEDLPYGLILDVERQILNEQV
jgi:hypothetical protein